MPAFLKGAGKPFGWCPSLWECNSERDEPGEHSERYHRSADEYRCYCARPERNDYRRLLEESQPEVECVGCAQCPYHPVDAEHHQDSCAAAFRTERADADCGLFAFAILRHSYLFRIPTEPFRCVTHLTVKSPKVKY